MKIGIDMGHSLSGAGTGASSLLTEVVENRKIGNRLIEILKEKGHTVVNCSVDSASSTSNQLSGIVKKANAQTLDLFVSIHLNAGGGHGTETYRKGWLIGVSGRSEIKEYLESIGAVLADRTLNLDNPHGRNRNYIPIIRLG